MSDTSEKKEENRSSSTCPVTFALDTFGDKWSLLIIRDLFFKKKRYYSDFLRSPEKISTNILANRLSKMEAAGLLSKQIDPDKSSKYIYSLTSKGKDLLPLILEMISWSATHDGQLAGLEHIVDGAPANLIERFQSDRDKLLGEILAGLD
ncbi:MAG: winged helix-turn-helix transcriptional regulator [Rhodothermales bacterium]